MEMLNSRYHLVSLGEAMRSNALTKKNIAQHALSGMISAEKCSNDKWNYHNLVTTQKRQFIMDEAGKPVAVILSLEDYARVRNILEPEQQ